MGPTSVGYYGSLQADDSGIFPAESSHDPPPGPLAESRTERLIDEPREPGVVRA